MRRRGYALTLLIATTLAGCAGTRVGQLGLLSNHESLVTVVVSQDRDVIHRECNNALSIGPILGCQMSRSSALPNGAHARTIKIVRYTDALPSVMAFEIEVHELCHAIAALQSIADPCHTGNDGVLQASATRHRLSH